VRAKTTLTIHKLDPLIEQRLRDRATRHGLSIEEEAERILEEVVSSTEDEPMNAYEAMRRPFRDPEGLDLELPT
jgi:antitoxin FitA